jgi:hypothetical protein
VEVEGHKRSLGGSRGLLQIATSHPSSTAHRRHHTKPPLRMESHCQIVRGEPLLAALAHP